MFAQQQDTPTTSLSAQQEVLGFCFSCHTGYVSASRVFWVKLMVINGHQKMAECIPGEQSRWIPGFWFSNVGDLLQFVCNLFFNAAKSHECTLWFHWSQIMEDLVATIPFTRAHGAGAMFSCILQLRIHGDVSLEAWHRSVCGTLCK